MNRQTIIISGATGVGKTDFAVKLCKAINGEIISADSRQVYKYLDIGTNKEGILNNGGIRVIDGISQYLTDLIEPDCKYNARNFEHDAEKYEKIIFDKNKIPVVVGGTGLYIKSFLYGLDNLPEADMEIRKNIKNDLQQYGLDYIYNKLYAFDKQSAEQNKGNTQRIIRALEVNLLTGRPMSSFFNKKNGKQKKFKHFFIVKDKELLYKSINNRCRKMINSGMVEETEKLINMGYPKDCYALTGIGYRHITQYLENKISKAVLIENFAKDTRQYTKRQITWFKHQPDIIAVTNTADIKNMLF